MQGVKADATARWIVDGVGQQMIDIHQHRGDHDQIGAFPVVPKKYPDHQRRDSSVQYKMKNCLDPNLQVKRISGLS